MTPNLQQKYFDVLTHQFPPGQTVTPLPSQTIEMDHLFSLIQPSPGATILDFGSGSGRISVYLLSKGFNVIAYDISPNSIKNLQDIYHKSKKPNWGKLTTFTSLPYQLKVDAVIGSDVLHHIPLDHELPNIFNLLNPKGKIAFSEPNPYNIFWYLYHFINKTPWKIESGIINCTRGNLFKKLKKHSFVNIKFTPHGIFPTRLFNWSKSICKLNVYLSSSLFPLSFFSYRNLITATK